MITVRVKYTPEELMDIITRNVTEFTKVDRTMISKADLQLFAEQLHTLKIVDNRTGVPLGWLTKKLVQRQINELLTSDVGEPDPPEDGGTCTEVNKWATLDW